MSELPISANFAFLAEHDPQIVRLGALAERYFRDDPATSLIKMRQFGETLAQLAAAKAGMFRDIQEGQADVIRREEGPGDLYEGLLEKHIVLSTESSESACTTRDWLRS